MGIPGDGLPANHNRGDQLNEVPAETTPEPASLNRMSCSHDAHEEDWSFFREALPKYEVTERIHYGGQGVVYKAVDRAAKRTVAIKVLLYGPLSSERQRQRLLREMEVVGRLQHPDIVTLYEAGEVRGRPFLVMEFVDGMPIDDYVLLNDLSVRQIVEIFGRVCRAVSSAHERGVIHRDLKPANILVDANGKLSVLDFGLAKDVAGNEADDCKAVSQTGQIVGTLPYLSPEQASGTNQASDVRSDIYSLGVVLFELITGCFPYPVDGSPDSVRDNIVSREPVPLRKALGRNTCDRPGALRDVNDDLEKVVLKALAKEKEHRYHSAASFADDLDRYFAGDAVEAKSASSLYVLRKSIRRLRLPIAVGSVLAAVVTTATLFVAAERIRTKTVAQLAESGLQMGGLLKLGSVHQDKGRLDQAIALFEAAIDIGKTVRRDDPAVLRYRYAAFHYLAELYYETGDSQKADEHAEAAIELADDVISGDPDNLEWVRQLGFSYRLKGRAALARKDWEEALAAFDKAASIRADLLSHDPDNRSLQSECASMLAWKGESLRKLRRYDEALEYFTAAYDIYLELAQLEPEVIDYLVELSRTEARIGVLHLCRKTEEDDHAAAKWLNRGTARLIELQDLGRSKSRAFPIDEILDHIRKNQELIHRRAERRSRSSD